MEGQANADTPSSIADQDKKVGPETLVLSPEAKPLTVGDLRAEFEKTSGQANAASVPASAPAPATVLATAVMPTMTLDMLQQMALLQQMQMALLTTTRRWFSMDFNGFQRISKKHWVFNKICTFCYDSR